MLTLRDCFPPFALSDRFSLLVFHPLPPQFSLLLWHSVAKRADFKFRKIRVQNLIVGSLNFLMDEIDFNTCLRESGLQSHRQFALRNVWEMLDLFLASSLFPFSCYFNLFFSSSSFLERQFSFFFSSR